MYLGVTGELCTRLCSLRAFSGAVVHYGVGMWRQICTEHLACKCLRIRNHRTRELGVIQVRKGHGAVQDADAALIVVGVASERWEKNATVVALDKALRGRLLTAAKEHDFHARARQCFWVDAADRLHARRIALVGLGNFGNNGATACTAYLHLGASAVRLGNQFGAPHVALWVAAAADDAGLITQTRLLSQGIGLGAYRFDRYLSQKGRPASVRAVSLFGASDADDKTRPGKKGKRASTKARGTPWPAAVAQSVSRGQIIAESVAIARDLVNEPAIEVYPESFAAQAVAMARRLGLGATVLKPADLKRRNMNLVLGVGAGSAHTPRLVHLRYTPAKSSKVPPVVLIGKGITFDSGGLSLKPSASMVDMKIDMAGAAAVLGTMAAIAQLKPKQPVHGIMVLAENMVSGEAIRPGDVITSAAGKTVEINNTDAEGRLVLADALTYAHTLKPARIVDLATLTGACMVALGPTIVGMFSNDEQLAQEILNSAQRAGEDMWRMPLSASLKDQLKSDIADLKNTGDRLGGAITAALFLKEFVGETPWVHLDIAGPASSKGDGGIYSKGATGVGVATLVDWLVP